MLLQGNDVSTVVPAGGCLLTLRSTHGKLVVRSEVPPVLGVRVESLFWEVCFGVALIVSEMRPWFLGVKIES